MKEKFKHFFSLSPDEIKSLWKTATFVLDTNVLLDIYRYTESTRSDFWNILDKLKDQIWIPHQVGYEFFNNRPTVIISLENVFNKINTTLKNGKEDLKNKIEQDISTRYHPSLNKDVINKKIEEMFDNFGKEIESKKEKYSELLEKDPILDRIIKFYDSKVGDEYPVEELKKIYNEGKLRYNQNIPPGYKDNSKEIDREMYGDLIIWKQIIDFSKSNKKNIIFITNDNKEDWWWQVSGRTLGSRRELLEEFYKETQMNFYMYTTERFMEFAEKQLKVNVDENSLSEVRKLKSRYFTSLSDEEANMILEQARKSILMNYENMNKNDEIIDNYKKFKERLDSLTKYMDNKYSKERSDKENDDDKDDVK